MPSNDFVFMVNDPITLKSSDISASSEDTGLEVTENAPRCTKRKPDVIGPKIAHLEKLMPECVGYTLDQWIGIVNHKSKELREARKKALPSDRTSWNDTSEAWEFKFTNILKDSHLAMLDPAGGFKVKDIFDHGKSQSRFSLFNYLTTLDR
jgi:hypothetical protein